MKALNELMETVLKKLELMAKTENVVGKPIEIGGNIILPLCKFSLGFGGGGGGANLDAANEAGGNGTAGGVTVEPVAVVVVSKDEIILLNVGERKMGAIATIAEAVPGIVEKIQDLRGPAKTEKSEKKI